MSEIDVKFNKFIKSFNVVASTPQLTRALHRIGSLLEYKVKENITKIGLVGKTGNLRASIKYNVDLNKDGGIVTIGSYGIVYAKIHEFGGTIWPKNAKRLTIPASPWAKGRRARDFNLIVIKNMLVDPQKIRRKNKDGKIPRNAIGFWLVRKSTIREKRYMRDAIDLSIPRITRILSELGTEK